jgi:hypothetical protein
MTSASSIWRTLAGSAIASKAALTRSSTAAGVAAGAHTPFHE